MKEPDNSPQCLAGSLVELSAPASSTAYHSDLFIQMPTSLISSMIVKPLDQDDLVIRPDQDMETFGQGDRLIRV